MGKFDKILNGGHKSFVIFALIVTVVMLLLLTFGPGNNLIDWVKAGIELRNQREQIRMYQSEIDVMNHKIEMLNSNRDSLERYAREQFLFTAPGDDLFIVE
ncbi:MAG: septum formation initiator family protein [Candidatus Cryptobacteroides sp.]